MRKSWLSAWWIVVIAHTAQDDYQQSMVPLQPMRSELGAGAAENKRSGCQSARWWSRRSSCCNSFPPRFRCRSSTGMATSCRRALNRPTTRYRPDSTSAARSTSCARACPTGLRWLEPCGMRRSVSAYAGFLRAALRGRCGRNRRRDRESIGAQDRHRGEQSARNRTEDRPVK